MNSENFSESALVELSLFFLACSVLLSAMSQKVQDKQQNGTLAIFFLHVQSYRVLCDEKIRRISRIHGRNSRQFFRSTFRPAFYVLCATLSHWDMNKIVKRASKKHQNGSLGGLGEALGGLGGPSTVSYGKRSLKSGSLTPSDTFFGTPFWSLFEPWAHFFHECSRFRLKNSTDFGCTEWCIDFWPFSDVNPEAKTF